MTDMIRKIRLGRCVRRRQHQPARVPSRHAEDTASVTIVPANVPDRWGRFRPSALAWSLPGHRHRHARCCTLVRHFLHQLRRLKILTRRVLVVNGVFASTCRACSQQFRRSARKLRRRYARGGA